MQHGDVVIWQQEDEESGKTLSLNVIEYIDQVLRQDGQELRDKLFRRVLQDAMAHKDEEGFRAEQFFLHHYDQEISELAFELLSSSTNPTLGQDADGKQKGERTDEEHPAIALVPHLLTDYKMGVVKEELQSVKDKLKELSATSDVILYKETMERYRELKESERKLSQMGGDRVIT